MTYEDEFMCYYKDCVFVHEYGHHVQVYDLERCIHVLLYLLCVVLKYRLTLGL